MERVFEFVASFSASDPAIFHASDAAVIEGYGSLDRGDGAHHLTMREHKDKEQDDRRVHDKRRRSAFSADYQPERYHPDKHRDTRVAEPKMPELELCSLRLPLGEPDGVFSFYLILEGGRICLILDFGYEGIFSHALFWLVSTVNAKQVDRWHGFSALCIGASESPWILSTPFKTAELCKLFS
jgi:hypothetical protein